jgi:LacI family repressor for deo operon, udp, cdd, tsx, nupC, and nupG
VVAPAPGLEGGAEAARTILAAARLPTALLAEYDEMAFGALRTLRRAGVDVPGQMWVIGVDDHDMASVVDLITVSQPVREQGKAAALLLLDALSGPRDTQHVVLPTRLVVRGTTAPPATDS